MGRLSEALEAHKQHLVKALEQRDRAAEGRVYGNLGKFVANPWKSRVRAFTLSFMGSDHS